MTETLTKLGVNWEVLLLQIVNFLVLLYILKRFLYQPILRVLEARRQKIAASMQKVDEIEQEMESIRHLREEIMAHAKKEASDTLLAAKQQSEALQQEMAALTQEKIQAMLAEGKQTLAAEKEQMLRATKEEIAAMVVMATERVIREQLSTEMNDRIIEHALRDVAESRQAERTA